MEKNTSCASITSAWRHRRSLFRVAWVYTVSPQGKQNLQVCYAQFHRQKELWFQSEAIHSICQGIQPQLIKAKRCARPDSFHRLCFSNRLKLFKWTSQITELWWHGWKTLMCYSVVRYEVISSYWPLNSLAAKVRTLLQEWWLSKYQISVKYPQSHVLSNPIWPNFLLNSQEHHHGSDATTVPQPILPAPPEVSLDGHDPKFATDVWMATAWWWMFNDF